MLKVMHQDSDPEDGDAWNPALGKFKRDTAITEQRKTEFTQTNLTVKYQVGDYGQIISSTNVQETKSNWLLQVGEIPGIGKILNQTDPYDSESFVQEIRFVSEPGDRLSWVAGALYSKIENGGRFAFVLDGLQDFVDAVAAPGIVTSDDFFAGPAEMDSSETAVYADMTWQFNEA